MSRTDSLDKNPGAADCVADFIPGTSGVGQVVNLRADCQSAQFWRYCLSLFSSFFSSFFPSFFCLSSLAGTFEGTGFDEVDG
jgi:hypothetical protein